MSEKLGKIETRACGCSYQPLELMCRGCIDLLTTERDNYRRALEEIEVESLSGMPFVGHIGMMRELLKKINEIADKALTQKESEGKEKE